MTPLRSNRKTSFPLMTWRSQRACRAQKIFTRLFFVEILVSYFLFSIVLEFLNFSTSVVLVSYKPVSYKKTCILTSYLELPSSYKLKGPKDVLLKVETIMNEYFKRRNILKQYFKRQKGKFHVCFYFYS